jgi:hypothetical protein
MKHPDSPDRHAAHPEDRPEDHAVDRDAAAAHLEQHISTLLREQPLQRAPATLGQRVLAAIEQRQRSAFQRWPLAARIAFVLLAGMTAHLSIGLMRLMGAGISAPRPPFTVMLAQTALDAARQLPSIWTYAAFAALILIYGGIFGLGIAMYRTVNPRH